MKNKKTIYFLLPIVLLIWGVVIYKFFSFTGKYEVTNYDTSVNLQPLQFKKSEPVIIKAEYRDPFLGKIYLPEKHKRRLSGIQPKTKVISEPVVWPNVVYKGMVSDLKNKKKVFMIVFNGQTHLVHENETVEDITVKKGNRTSIDVKYKGDVTTILLQE